MVHLIMLLADWSARKNLYDTVIFTMFIITDTIQVWTITVFIILLQSGGALS